MTYLFCPLLSTFSRTSAGPAPRRRPCAEAGDHERDHPGDVVRPIDRSSPANRPPSPARSPASSGSTAPSRPRQARSGSPTDRCMTSIRQGLSDARARTAGVVRATPLAHPPGPRRCWWCADRRPGAAHDSPAASRCGNAGVARCHRAQHGSIMRPLARCSASTSGPGALLQRSPPPCPPSRSRCDSRGRRARPDPRR